MEKIAKMAKCKNGVNWGFSWGPMLISLHRESKPRSWTAKLLVWGTKQSSKLFITIFTHPRNYTISFLYLNKHYNVPNLSYGPMAIYTSSVLLSIRSLSCNISNFKLFLFLLFNFAFFHLVHKLSSTRQSSHFCIAQKHHLNILTTKTSFFSSFPVFM